VLLIVFNQGREEDYIMMPLLSTPSLLIENIIFIYFLKIIFNINLSK
jgi:hypothetical protein